MRILRIAQKNFSKITKEVTKSLERGEVIICPTDTVYGLLCDAFNEEAVRKLFKIKKRLLQKPVPIFVKNLKMAKKLAFINKNQEEFLKKFWPGKTTFIFKRKKRLPKILFGKKTTIGLRIPDYKLVNVLLQKLDKPLTGTSANISGRPFSTKIKEVIPQFKNQLPTKFDREQPDLVLDAGNLKPAKPSTIIDLTHKKPKILRK